MTGDFNRFVAFLFCHYAHQKDFAVFGDDADIQRADFFISQQ